MNKTITSKSYGLLCIKIDIKYLCYLFVNITLLFQHWAINVTKNEKN